MKWVYDLLFGARKTSYARARANTAAASTSAPDTLASLDGKDSFLFGSTLHGAAVQLAPDGLGHGLTCGASGSGKSSALSLIVEGFEAAPGHRVEIIDPKGETCIALAEHAAMTHVRLPQDQRQAFAERFHVIDVRDDAVTPTNLFAVPPQMSPALLASLRASAMVNAGEHEFSDLMQHGLFLVFSVAIALQRGITKKFVRRLLLDDAFRQRTLAPKIHDPGLRDSIGHLDDVLPTATRQALRAPVRHALEHAPRPHLVRAVAVGDRAPRAGICSSGRDERLRAARSLARTAGRGTFSTSLRPAESAR